MLKKLGYKDRKNRTFFQQKESQNLLTKTLKKNCNLYNIDAADLAFLSRSNKSLKTRIRNRCILTNRGRGIVSKFKISRIVFRQKAGSGEVAGIYKSN